MVSQEIFSFLAFTERIEYETKKEQKAQVKSSSP